ncbi:MAG: hypothetical protein ABMB14_05885 [Myxococcota bacterium]
MPRIARYGSVGMRLAEHGPALTFTADGSALVAVSERPFADRTLQVFELLPSDPPSEPGAGAAPAAHPHAIAPLPVGAGFPSTRRHVGPKVGPYEVFDGHVAAVLRDELTRVVVLRLPDLEVVRRVEAPGEIAVVAVSPVPVTGGQRIVVGLVTGEIVRLDPDGKRVVVARTARPTAIAFAPSGDRVAVGTESGVVEVVWVAEVKVLTTLRGGRTGVTAVQFTPDEAGVVAATGKAVWWWSVKGGGAATVERGAVSVGIVGFTPSGLLITSSTQERVAAHELPSARVATGRMAWTIEAYGPTAIAGDRVWSVRFQELRQLDASTGDVVATIDASQFVEAIAPVRNEPLVVVALSTGTELRVADVATGTWSGGAGGHESEVLCVQFAGDRFVTGGLDTRACLWKIGRSTPLITTVAPTGYSNDHATAVALDEPRGALWVAFGERVTRCTLADGGVEYDSELLGAKITAIAPIPGSSLLLACTEAREVPPPPGTAGKSRKRAATLHLLDVESLDTVHTDRVERTYRRVRVRSDGKLRLDGALGWAVYDPLARAVVDSGVTATRDPSREHHRSGDDTRLVEVANRPRPDGGQRGLLFVTELPAGWTLVDGLELPELSGRADLSVSGRYLATPHKDQRVRVWDLERSACVAEYDVGIALTGVWFFPDEWRILGTSRDGALIQVGTT